MYLIWSKKPMTQNESLQSCKKSLIWIIFICGILFAVAFSVTLDYTNTTEFCTSCHTMQINLKELEETEHHKNVSGVTAGCPDCHVPRALGPKLWAKLMAVKDVYHEFIGTIDTPEKYEARRWEMANRVWDKMRANDSQECRHCHDFKHMNFEEQDRTAARKHQKVKVALDKLAINEQMVKKAVKEILEEQDDTARKKQKMREALEKGAKTCIDCHTGIAHEEPEEPE